MARQKLGREQLQELANQVGMTYAKMGRLLQVDRKTAKKWCDEEGIVIGKPVVKKEEPAKTPAALPPPPASDIVKNLEKRIKDLEDQVEKICAGLRAHDDRLDEVLRERDEILNLADRLQANEENVTSLSPEDQQFLTAIRYLCEMAMRPEINNLHRRINNHTHVSLNLIESKDYLRERRARREG